jgi:hypothetical protein
LQAINYLEGPRAMSLEQRNVREIIEHVFTHQDVKDLCQGRDLGAIIGILGTHGISLAQIARLTGIAQGRLQGSGVFRECPISV